ncbi:MAG: hypothetical protein WCO10_01915 [bacterium]
MSKQIKFLQVSTILRAGIDPDKIPMARYDDLLSEGGLLARADLIRGVEAVLSGEVKIHFALGKVTFKRKVFRPKSK